MCPGTTFTKARADPRGEAARSWELHVVIWPPCNTETCADAGDMAGEIGEIAACRIYRGAHGRGPASNKMYAEMLT